MPGAAAPREGPSPAVDFLRALYAQVLGKASVGPDDDFFADLSGNSLGAAEIVVTVERLFGVRILEAFFDDSTPAGVAAELERGLREAGFDPERAREAASSGPAASGPVAEALAGLLDALGSPAGGDGDGPGRGDAGRTPGGPA